MAGTGVGCDSLSKQILNRPTPPLAPLDHDGLTDHSLAETTQLLPPASPPQSLLSSVQEDPRFMALPGAAAALEALHSEITSTLSDALLAKVSKGLCKGRCRGPLASRKGPTGRSALMITCYILIYDMIYPFSLKFRHSRTHCLFID